MKIATFNVNGINGRFPVLFRWLAEATPDVVCLQEFKAPQEKFPVVAIRDAGYGAIWPGRKSWNGVAILARGADPIETQRGPAGDPEDVHSRYIEAAVNGLLIGCLYLPNGNPAQVRSSTISCAGSTGSWRNRQALVEPLRPMIAAEIRRKPVDRMRPQTQWRWHLDEVYVKINGEMHYLWRAVDHEDEVLESFASNTRDKAAALKLD